MVSVQPVSIHHLLPDCISQVVHFILSAVDIFSIILRENLERGGGNGLGGRGPVGGLGPGPVGNLGAGGRGGGVGAGGRRSTIISPVLP
ncbi:MAG: hypothetical protein F4Z87_07290 [Gammaproteobacteria bacterium]|nr:hypothetical protein [Gammaproteobacteria bacterium]